MLPESERYIQSVISRDSHRIVVTAHADLIKFIHDVLCLQIDFTFKRVEGEFNEWEVVGFLEKLGRRKSHEQG